MVVAIEGIITKKEPTFAVIKCQNGVSYGVFISLFCSSKLKINEKIELLITQIIKEDSNKFFGFLDKDEQKVFEMLLKVNGVGTSTAMAVCSSLDTNSFYKALALGDESVLKKVPGIGVKSAKRIIVELGDMKKIESISDDKHEAYQALLSLGFKQDKILSVLATCESKDTSELIKEALKKLA
ncbi:MULTISPECIES: Holliday junction branch migration protein RuvA [unclassified Campylobacter]|uniref:Holliday junction branch migration protein RuvA n=1 Tax=unclassified Campylobacter TaxID=2593542 RepID=UPI0012382D65|nr:MULTISPECIES: Holliday junction branch migration protein RuvA [unclassified Campylobacter]KAA6225353.1 Holliday junction branch migration protein RuvA [Campylobacter sp. LR185c]KAA6227049.1 Holliday junction branch migration protein RuvA [Campylobacter sp. LR196d]KAA6227620.1 Holliday junction branch migration protein RuvA [Campylobacter sp. LR286c]KAA6229485.1 Holliday junction branch migration protein RuvA [Campylobacter sp. LR264d]KAA6230730.1 Holliday junction branch migration protein R